MSGPPPADELAAPRRALGRCGGRPPARRRSSPPPRRSARRARARQSACPRPRPRRSARPSRRPPPRRPARARRRASSASRGPPAGPGRSRRGPTARSPAAPGGTGSASQALDLVFAERPQHAPGGLLAIGVPDDQLGDHRVIHRRHFVAGLHAGVHAHAGAGRLAVGADPARRGCEFLDASSALMRHSIACPRSSTSTWAYASSSPAAARMPSLTMSIPVVISVTQCSTCTRVFISRKKYSGSASSREREQALDRAGSDVVDGLRGVHADLADAFAHLWIDHPLRRRRLLDHLLVAALDRAVALAQVDDVAVAVGQHLHLDVARIGQVALQVDGRVGEELLAFAARALERRLQLLLGERDAKALAAAPAGRLDRDREADLVAWRSSAHPATVATGSVVPGTIGTPAACISSRARVFEPIASIALAGGPMNTTSASSHALRERRVLGEKAVARVDRLRARAPRRRRGSSRRSGSSPPPGPSPRL